MWALIVFVPWLFVMGLALRDWYNDFQLGTRAVRTSGVITRIERKNHGQYDYEYSVDGTSYEGREIVSGASLGVGQRVQVNYIRDDPQTSRLTRFGEVGGRPVPMLFVSFVALICYIRLREFLKPPANPYGP